MFPRPRPRRNLKLRKIKFPRRAQWMRAAQSIIAMKKISSICFIIAAACAMAFAQTTNLPGIRSTTVLSLNDSNILSQKSLTSITNNTFTSGSSWASAPSGWVTNLEMLQTNIVFAHTGATAGYVGHMASVSNRSNSRFRSTFIIDASGMPQTSAALIAGFATNAAGGIPLANGNQIIGVQLDQSSQHFILRNASSGSAEGANGNITWTNGTYNICVSTDPTNLSFCVVYPGHTNEFRSFVNWSGLAPGSVLSNFVAGFWAGTNGTLGASGGRIGSQSILPRTGTESASDFVLWSQDAHVGPGQTRGDLIRVSIPAQYDSATNIGNLMIYCHGNGGSYAECYDGFIGDEVATGDSIPGYFNALNTNNFIIASYFGDDGNTGRTDSWGTSNSLACIDALIAYLRPRYAWSNIFLWGDSAGGLTALNYAAARHEKIAGLILNHAIANLTNYWPARSADINAAYGGSTPAQFAGYDASTYPNSVFTAIPIRVTASTGDTIVPKTTQTDPLVIRLGGIVGGNVTNTIYCPEIDDFPVAGGAGIHGGTCYTPAVAAGDIAFLKRCLVYASLAPNPGFRPLGGTTTTTNTPGIHTFH